MKNLYKLSFFALMISGTLITISSSSWIMMWAGLEINLLSIIPLLTNVKNKMESEASMKYFITQALASTIFLFSTIALMSKTMTQLNSSSILMDCAILTKMGAAPFHFWFPEIMEGLNWSTSTIMLTWQKIAPMVIFMYLPKSIIVTTMTIMSSMMISGLMGINQTSLRKILAYSSINHIGWMIGAMMTNQAIWMMYMIIYTLMTINITFMLKMNNIFQMNQLMNSMNQSKSMKIMFSLNFLSLGGLPPFIGFIPKWMTINNLIDQKLYPLTLMMIIMTLMTLFFYMRITVSAMTMSNTETMKQNQSKQQINNYNIKLHRTLSTINHPYTNKLYLSI
uniref:NADH-ubiquinone oxidoreductase chain 2 n=1 Tax=Trogoderma granarium TaxID=591392 RepID=A0A5H2V6B7_9COLE|nr:NADH dehydrogenase subunit 2 [Trogoderma granarium]